MVDIAENLCSGKFHNNLRDMFAPQVVRYVDLMESSIAQSIHKGFEKEQWKIQGFFYPRNLNFLLTTKGDYCLSYLFLSLGTTSSLSPISGCFPDSSPPIGPAAPRQKTCCGNWKLCSRSFTTSIGPKPYLPNTSTTD